jgi:hypothetical protein
MVAAAARGLSESDLDQIREALGSGKKPRVVFTESAGQVAGQVGHVIGLTDAAASDEWIVVRFGNDELPFSPTDLSVRGRSTQNGSKAAPSRPTQRRVTTPAPPPLAQPLSPSRRPRRTPELTMDRKASAPPAQEEPTMSNSTVDTPPAAPNGVAANGGKPVRVPKPKAPATLTVTLAYAEREWTVTAHQGTKTIAKPYQIKPTDALRLVAILDVPGVHQAVEQIIAAERAEAEGRAQRLRAELAQIETRLAELTHRS